MRDRVQGLFRWASAEITWDFVVGLARRLWPLIGPSVFGLILLLWGVLRGNLGPELVAIVLTFVILTTSSLFAVASLRRFSNRLDERLQIPVSAVEEKPKPNPLETRIFVLIHQGKDLLAAVEKVSPKPLAKPLRESFRTWGYGVSQYLEPIYPGRASFFASDLPGSYDHVYGREALQYLNDKLEVLNQILQEIRK